ncbi:hypothetical protein [Actomonas aquatica]|uniref:Uncharacterized protein n=1 Tax=Actomonas aquatica TaxID=2866162 RepID=A0ABZ1CCJ4_9BACT|nr:hypothetical protein [Opitutus sp. WL0086]WRQ89365.1 hypothetical protein K1X11_008085 [Opitutus sp. WL0086]
MIRRSARLVLSLLGTIAVTFALAQQPTTESTAGRVRTPAPVKNYTVSFFSDEGYPWVRVLGETADLRDPTAVVLGDTIITVYTGLEDRGTEATLTAPVAVLAPEPRLVTGPDAVRWEQRDLTVEGEDWSYEYLGPQEHRLHLKRNAHVIFETPMVDLIK